MQAHPSGFLFATCQVGAERALKAEVASKWPDFHFAYSRPGFATFKLPERAALADDFNPGLVFARAYGFSLGKVEGQTPAEMAVAARLLMGGRDVECVHVWQRDQSPTGHHGFEPGPTPLSAEVELALRQSADAAGRAFGIGTTSLGQLVLDCVILEPDLCWLGYHRAATIAQTWPGGVPPVSLPADAVSRAYLKMEESLLWSELPIRAGERCAEIGAAPGGASQALLARGLSVVGIDPAEIDPRVTAHPNFTHVKKRGADLKRREFRGIRWLAADINVAPAYTLDTVEAIVTYPTVDVRGVLLTLKLLDWKLAEELPAYLARIKSWGYDRVIARQLAFNRREVCVAATKTPPAKRRSPGQRRGGARPR